MKEQMAMLTDFVDTLFRKNSVRGVNGEEPLNYDLAMDAAKAVLTKHGHSSLGNFFGVDPYAGGMERKSNNDDQIRQLNSKIAKLERENNDLRRRGPSYDNRGPSYDGRGPSGAQLAGGKSYHSMTQAEKQRITCHHYNTHNGCNKTEVNGHCGQGTTKLKHGCNVAVDNERLCWKRHRAVDHV